MRAAIRRPRRRWLAAKALRRIGKPAEREAAHPRLELHEGDARLRRGLFLPILDDLGGFDHSGLFFSLTPSAAVFGDELDAALLIILGAQILDRDRRLAGALRFCLP
jgi:hypothetical protein